MQANPMKNVIVNKTLLNLIDIDPTNIAFLERNHFIPCSYDQFAKLSWVVLAPAIKNLAASTFNELGEIAAYYNVTGQLTPTLTTIKADKNGYRCEIELPNEMRMVRYADQMGNMTSQYIEQKDEVILQSKREYNVDGVQVNGTDYGIQPKQIEQPDGTMKITLTIIGESSSSSEIGANGLIAKLVCADDTVEFIYDEGAPVAREIISTVAGKTTYEYDSSFNVTAVTTRGERNEINNIYDGNMLDVIEVDGVIVFDASEYHKFSRQLSA